MIHIIKHKEYNNPVPQNYKELFVGDMFKYNYKKENINKFNPYINEATGVYHIWKNHKDKIVGLCHYRRFFYYNDNILSLKESKEILKDYDIIVAKDVVFNRGIYEQLRSEFVPYDRVILDKYYNLLIDKEPDLKRWFEFKKFNPKEMFVCDRKLLNKYCEWLFPMIIPVIEQFVKEDKDEVLNKRMIGHLVERLFAFWIWKNNLKVYKMDYIDI